MAQAESMPFTYGTVTPFGAPSQKLRLGTTFVTARGLRNVLQPLPTTPALQRLRAYTKPVWAVPRSLAATRRIVCLLSFPAGTEMFHFPALTSHGYVFTMR